MKEIKNIYEMCMFNWINCKVLTLNLEPLESCLRSNERINLARKENRTNIKELPLLGRFKENTNFKVKETKNKV